MPFNSKEFPSSKDLARVQEELEFYRFYESDVHDYDVLTERGKFRLKEFFEGDKKKAQLLDRAFNVVPNIVDKRTSFLFGEPIKIETDESDEQSTEEKQLEEIMERNNLQVRFAESTKLYDSVGHAHFKLYKENDKAVIEEIPHDQWFPNWDQVSYGQEPKNVRIVVYMEGEIDGKTQKYIYVEDYYMEGTAKIGKSLWEDNAKKLGKQVPLDTLGIKSTGEVDPNNSLTMVEDTGLDELPLVTINRPKSVKQRMGKSLFTPVKTLLYEVNDRITQLSVQFLKHLNAKMQIPESAIQRDENGNIVKVNLEVILAQNGDPDAKYITNDNPLVEQAFVQIEKVMRKIAKDTDTPDRFLVEEEKGGVEKVASLKIQMMPFLKSIRMSETFYAPAIKKILRLAMKIEGSKEKDVPITLKFDRGLPKDWEHDVSVWGEAYASGLASQETSVRRFQDLEGDELKEEIGRIEGDRKKMMESQLQLQVSEDDDEGDEE